MKQVIMPWGKMQSQFSVKANGTLQSSTAQKGQTEILKC